MVQNRFPALRAFARPLLAGTTIVATLAAVHYWPWDTPNVAACRAQVTAQCLTDIATDQLRRSGGLRGIHDGGRLLGLMGHADLAATLMNQHDAANLASDDLTAFLRIRQAGIDVSDEDLAYWETRANRSLASYRIVDAIREGATFGDALAAAPNYDGASLWRAANEMLDPTIATIAPRLDMVDALTLRLAAIAPSARLSPGLSHRYAAELFAARGNRAATLIQMERSLLAWPDQHDLPEEVIDILGLQTVIGFYGNRQNISLRLTQQLILHEPDQTRAVEWIEAAFARAITDPDGGFSDAERFTLLALHLGHNDLALALARETLSLADDRSLYTSRLQRIRAARILHATGAPRDEVLDAIGLPIDVAFEHVSDNTMRILGTHDGIWAEPRINLRVVQHLAFALLDLGAADSAAMLLHYQGRFWETYDFGIAADVTAQIRMRDAALLLDYFRQFPEHGVTTRLNIAGSMSEHWSSAEDVALAHRVTTDLLANCCTSADQYWSLHTLGQRLDDPAIAAHARAGLASTALTHRDPVDILRAAVIWHRFEQSL